MLEESGEEFFCGHTLVPASIFWFSAYGWMDFWIAGLLGAGIPKIQYSGNPLHQEFFLIFWRMPACAHPTAAGGDDVPVVEVQGRYRRGDFADYLCSIIAPFEMLRP